MVSRPWIRELRHQRRVLCRSTWKTHQSWSLDRIAPPRKTILWCSTFRVQPMPRKRPPRFSLKLAIGDSDLINVRFAPLRGLKSDISRV
jgi:hypothetical protein